MPEFLTRLAVTLGALAIYRLGASIPVAFLDPEALANFYQTSGSIEAIERISIFALGVGPILGALFLVECGRLVSERFNDWVDAAPSNARRVNHYALLGALLIAALQGISIAYALEAATEIVVKPGPQFRLSVMAAMVASTALLAWLATLISRYGLGSGIWILLLAPFLASAPNTAWYVYRWHEFYGVQAGVHSGESIIATALYILAALATVVAFARALSGLGMPLERTLIWPLFMANWMLSLLKAIALVGIPDLMNVGTIPLLEAESPVWPAVLAVVVIMLSLAQWQRLKARPAAAAPSSPPVPAMDLMPVALTAAALVGISVLPGIITAYFKMPLQIDPLLLTTLVIVALPILDLLQRRQA
jgi:hypothetical protein